ncbi:MAG: tetratricopeptide repeat protein [Planctomycetales bacterium]|nr:tetratricopeptide repeat protein [Planctomycetales bacterium]
MSASARNTAQPVDLGPGDRLGAYCIERLLGSGGMSDVFYAIHQGLQRPAAIKVLRASLAADEIHLQRFMQEARAAASLVHPNIVQVYDVGQDGQHRYIAQEYIPGSNLRQYLATPAPADPATRAEADPPPHSSVASDRQLSIRETLSILLQVLAALHKSASSGIVHRDIKPENIMLTQDGDVKVADFGLARVLLGDDPQLTRAGTTLGTPMYMSPEQIQEGHVDIRSDLYSLGVTLFHMLGGRPPFTGETPLALAMQHVQAEPPSLQKLRGDIPLSLQELVSRLLAKNPAERLSSPNAALTFLRSHRRGDLSADWPDQILPLPDVALLHSGGPMQATLALQSKLRPQRRRAGGKLIFSLSLCVLLAGCFSLGAWLGFTPAFPIESTAEYRGGIVKQSSVEEQYRWALLHTDSNPLWKWEAVNYFFPQEADPLNRHYAGLASLQLARAHFTLKDEQAARRELQHTLDDQHNSFIKALAHLQIAEIEAELNRPADRNAAIDRALELAAGEKITSSDQSRLDDYVQLLDDSIRQYWSDRRSQAPRG